ncbi:hypothetical protein LCGC14_1004780 [marine sediment metagenome]|uniref:Uncharacterized protein n=1 Tax=marine sediment metagenome TaxID=412755 RepID=A0A0F9R823_9ZZZZ|nr:hypothetical protein [Methylophaga sp.]
MSITDKSDAEIIDIAQPMIDDVVNASNQRDWEAFSQYQTEEEANDPDNKKNVETLWKEHKLFTSLSLDREILAVLRNDDVAQVIWKQSSTEVFGDYLGRYFIKEINQDIKEVGFLIH